MSLPDLDGRRLPVVVGGTVTGTDSQGDLPARSAADTRTDAHRHATTTTARK